MANFTYRGRDQAGARQEGVMEADSVNTVASKLGAMGVTPLEIELVKMDQGRSQLQAVADWFHDQVPVTPQDLSLLCRQLYAMLHVGVPINIAMRDIVETFRHQGLVRALLNITENIEEGFRFSDSLERYPKIFPPLFVQMVRTGEETGKMDEIFLHLAEHVEKEAGFKDKMMSALRYPIFMVIAALAAMMVISVWVIPAFTEMLANTGGELPTPTVILMATSDFFINYSVWVVVGIVLLIAAYIAHRKTPEGREFWDRVLLRVPVFGEMSRTGILSQFTRSLALVSKSGVPLSQGIELVAGTLGNLHYENKILEFKARIDEGIPFSQAAREIGIFTPMVIQIFRVGEQTGKIDELLEHVSTVYDREVNHTMDNINTLIEPLMLALIGSLVLMLALGVMLPYLEMIKSAAIR